eukprot:NODE_55_length_26219_cov_0.194908.p18 type:complete len:117 gc:universal NODE_55_length_26219_cov_0.194908:19208-19558(+)
MIDSTSLEGSETDLLGIEIVFPVIEDTVLVDSTEPFRNLPFLERFGDTDDMAVLSALSSKLFSLSFSIVFESVDAVLLVENFLPFIPRALVIDEVLSGNIFFSSFPLISSGKDPKF